MRLADFASLAAKRERRLRWAAFGPVIVLVAGVLPCAFWNREWRAFLGGHFSSTAADVLMVLPPILLTLFTLPLILPRVRRVDREARIPCPNCGHGLSDSAMVIASKACPECKQRVIDEVPAVSAYEGMDLALFQHTARQFKRSSAIAVFVPLTVGWLALFALIIWGPLSRLPEALRPWPLFIPVMGTFAWLLWWSRRLERRFALPCPHCQKNLAESLRVVEPTGHCPFCGERVIKRQN
jgi:uncharacterized membrane protein